MSKELKALEAALKIIAAPARVITQEELGEADAPLTPYFEGKNAPPKFPYEEYTLMPPTDARKIHSTLDALGSRAKQLSSLEENYRVMRKQVEKKILTLQTEEGYDKIKQEMATFRDKLVGEVVDTTEVIGDALIEYNNRLLTIVNRVTEGAPTPKQQSDALVAAIKKFASPEIAGKIIEDADAVIKAAADAKTTYSRTLTSWPSPQDLRKKIKQEEVPASKQAGIIDTLKGFLSKAMDSLKGVWSNLTDKLSSLVSSTEAAEPVMQEIEQLAADVFANPATPDVAPIEAALSLENVKTADLDVSDVQRELRILIGSDPSLEGQVQGKRKALLGDDLSDTDFYDEGATLSSELIPFTKELVLDAIKAGRMDKWLNNFVFELIDWDVLIQELND